MERILAEATSARVSVKATSNEGMGWIGRGEGIACIAVRDACEQRIVFTDRWRMRAANLSSLKASVADSIFEARVLREAGILGADAPRQGAADRRHLPALGRLAGDRRRHRGDPPPARDRDDRRTRRAQLRAPAPPLQRARPRLRRAGGRPRRRGRDHVPQPPRLPRGDAGGGQARRQRALPEHDVRRPAAGRGDAPRGAEGAGLRRGVRGPAGGRRRFRARGSSAGTRRGAGGADDARAADRRRRRRRPPAAAGQAALRDPHLGHDRHAEGRPALQPRRPARDRRADRQDPLPQPRDDDDRGAALPLLGLLPLRHEPADRLDDGAAPPLRPRGRRCARCSAAAPRCWRRCR